MPIQASVFSRWSAQYAAIPVDYREYETVSDREQFHAAWMSNQQAGEDVDGEEIRLPSMHEAQYLDYVFNTLRQAGFVRLLSFWGRTLNLLSLRAARKHLENQNSHFANAPALKIYKFHPDAYAVMLDHFMTGESRKGTKRAGVRGPDLSTHPKDKFPNGYGRDF